LTNRWLPPVSFGVLSIHPFQVKGRPDRLRAPPATSFQQAAGPRAVHTSGGSQGRPHHSAAPSRSRRGGHSSTNAERGGRARRDHAPLTERAFAGVRAGGSARTASFPTGLRLDWRVVEPRCSVGDTGEISSPQLLCGCPVPVPRPSIATSKSRSLRLRVPQIAVAPPTSPQHCLTKFVLCRRRMMRCRRHHSQDSRLRAVPSGCSGRAAALWLLVHSSVPQTLQLHSRRRSR